MPTKPSHSWSQPLPYDALPIFWADFHALKQFIELADHTDAPTFRLYLQNFVFE